MVINKFLASLVSIIKSYWSLFCGGLIGAIMLIPIISIALTNYLVFMGVFWSVIFIILVYTEFMRSH